jgi:ABC-2 type transport system permease protein
MRQIFYLVQKEFRQISRDRAMMAILFVAPLIQIFILGNAVTTDVVHLTMVINDQDRTPLSRTMIQSFTHSKYFDIVAMTDEYASLPQILDQGTARLALVIPRHFQRDAVQGAQPIVQLLVDGIDGNSAGIAVGYVSDIVQRYQAQLARSEPQLGKTLASMRRVEAEPRFWYNPNLESRVYIVPGIIALILLIITVFLTSMGIVREKEIGTLEQLMVTPIRSYQLIAGKVIPFAVLGFLEINIAILFVYLIFGIGIKGSFLILFGESALFILTALGVGIFVSTISETQQQALFVAWFFMIFSILLSGFFIPIANMPPSIQVLTYLNPLRYFFVILREIYLKGTGLRELFPETLALFCFGVGVFSIAVLRFRRKLS